MARITVDLPQPDSPTTPRMCPGSSAKSIWSRMRATPSSLRIDSLQAAHFEDRVGARAGGGHRERRRRGSTQIAQPVAQQVEAEHRDQDGEPGEDRIPPGARQVVAALGDGQPPIRRRRRRAHAEKAEHRRHQDREAHADRRAHDDRRHRVRQDVQKHDARVAGADAAQRVDKQRSLQPPRLGIDQAREERPIGQRQRHHRAFERRRHQLRQGERQHQLRQGEKHVGDAHDRLGQPAAAIAGDEPERHADRGGDTTTMTATSSAPRAPRMTRDSMSRPRLSVPNGKAALGGFRRRSRCEAAASSG